MAVRHVVSAAFDSISNSLSGLEMVETNALLKCRFPSSEVERRASVGFRARCGL